MKLPPYLQVIPMPLAKCGPLPAPYPASWDLVELRRVGGTWRIVGQQQGRLVEMRLTTEALRDLVGQAQRKLREEGICDVDE